MSRTQTQSKRQRRRRTLAFAYGSLLNTTIQDILFGRITPRPVQASMSRKAGFARVWTLNPSGKPRVGIFEGGDNFPADHVNGVMFELTDEELASFQVYELPTYVPIRVPARFFRVCGRRLRCGRNDSVLVYRPAFEYAPMDLRQYIPDVYVSTVFDGFRRYGNAYVQRFMDLTYYEPVSTTMGNIQT